MIKEIKAKLFKDKRNIKWTFFDRHRICPSCEAYSEVKEMNKHYREFEKKNPYCRPLRATINPLPNGMAEILIWYGNAA